MAASGRKTFVLDTNVILHDPRSIFGFEENEVVLPIYVIEEIDNFKKELSELGRNARQVARYLDALRQEGKLTAGVLTDAGGVVRVAISDRELPVEFRTNRLADDRILATALDCHERAVARGGRATILVTKDVNLRIRADALGLTVEDYDSERTDISELYSGVALLDVDSHQLDVFRDEGRMPLDDPYYFPSQFAVMTDRDDGTRVAVGKISIDEQAVLPLTRLAGSLWGIHARNREQACAIDLLLNDELKVVTLVGKAGTGKTLLAIAAGLHKVTEESVYQRLLIARPVLPLGRDIGYLPGNIEEKLTPWMQPIFDNIEFLMGLSRAERRQGRSYHELMDLGVVEIEPLTYIRGRSIPNQFIVIDEAQNLTPHEVKTIITRAGDNTKIVLTGDAYQIDNPYVDSTNNGLVHTVNRFRQERIAGHITLMKGERSELAELAANLL